MITKKKFQKFEDARRFGENMMEVIEAAELDGLTSKEVIEIVKNYSSYAEKYDT